MVKQTACGVFWISDRHPSLEVKLTIHVEALGSQNRSVGIHMDPLLIPEQARNKLFFRCICDGVNAAVADSAYRVPLSDFEVDIADTTLHVYLLTCVPGYFPIEFLHPLHIVFIFRARGNHVLV